jgi:hypothetical protein
MEREGNEDDIELTGEGDVEEGAPNLREGGLIEGDEKLGDDGAVTGPAEPEIGASDPGA